jgi:hypothetical protein
MIAQENKYVNVSGTFPNALMIDASGAGLTDGSEFAALPLNDGWEPFQQAMMSYASGVQKQNLPTGSVGVPNGVADAVGISQMLEALQLAHGIGPGKGVLWFGDDDPSVTGDRVIILAGQGVLIATYPGLDAATYVGDANNAAVGAAGGGFYRSSDAGGATPNIAGPYLQLPDAAGRTVRMLDTSGTVDPQGAGRFLGDVQIDAMQKITGVLGVARFNGGADFVGDTTGVFSLGTVGGALVGAPNSAGNFTRRLVNFASDASTSPNAAKTDDDETRMTNISIKMGITY